MPSADYQSTARAALALPLSPSSSRSNSFDARHPSTSTTAAPRPAWRQTASSRSIRSRHSIAADARSTFKSLLAQSEKLGRRGLKTFSKLSPVQKVFAVGIIGGTIVFGILVLVFNERILGWLAPLARRWKGTTGGWTILWALTFLTAFPPVIGYSWCGTIAGFVYGVWEGWLIYASATIVGSTCSFLVSRTILSKFVHRLVANDKRFAALTLTLKHDGLKLICMIRLCPLPYSLSNGAMSTFPTVHPLMYALATTLVSPKLLIHVFIGSRLGVIAESGEEMPLGTKVVNWVSILLGGAIGATVGYYIYQRTMARARQLEEEERTAIRARTSSSSPNASRRAPSNNTNNDTPDFPIFSDADDNDAEDVEAAINTLARDELTYHDDDDDEGDEDVGRKGSGRGRNGGYRDEFTDGEESDVFGEGDGDEEEVIGLHRHQGGR